MVPPAVAHLALVRGGVRASLQRLVFIAESKGVGHLSDLCALGGWKEPTTVLRPPATLFKGFHADPAVTSITVDGVPRRIVRVMPETFAFPESETRRGTAPGRVCTSTGATTWSIKSSQ